MTDKIFKTIEKYEMIKKGDTVAVCLSGGADSMALFHFLYHNRENLGIQVLALHVNHGLREESRQEEIFVKDYCGKMGAQFIVYNACMNDKEKPQGLSTETWARQLRYDFFFCQAEIYGAKLATAHTLSDRCETVLFNITRGASLKGACGIPAVRDKIIRPLIACTREDIEQYCRENNIPFVTDRTNFEDVYSRNKIRLHVIPQLKNINSAAETAIGNFADENEEIYTFLTQLSDNLYRKSVGENGLDTNVLLSRHPVVLKNLLRNRLEKLDCLSKDNIQAIMDGVKQPYFKRQLSAGVFCSVENGWLFFHSPPPKSQKIPKIPVEFDKNIHFSYLDLYFSLCSYEEYKKNKRNDKNYLTYCMNYDRIKGNLYLRTRESGDRFTMPGRNVTKSLKKLFIEDKIPAAFRDKIPVLCDEDGRVVWLAEYGVSKPYIPGEDAEKILIIKQM